MLSDVLDFVICLNMVLTALADLCVLIGMSSPEQHQTAYRCICNCAHYPCISFCYVRVEVCNLNK